MKFPVDEIELKLPLLIRTQLELKILNLYISPDSNMSQCLSYYINGDYIIPAIFYSRDNSHISHQGVSNPSETVEDLKSAGYKKLIEKSTTISTFVPKEDYPELFL